MRRILFSLLSVFFAIALLSATMPGAFVSAANNDAGQPWGAWYWVTDISAIVYPGTATPTLVTFFEDGSLSSAEGTMFGGYEGATEVYTTGHGSWARTSGGNFRGTRLSMIFDKATGVLIGYSRSRFSFHFSGGFDELEGTLYGEALYFDNPFEPPDPLDPEAEWIPMTPPEGLPTKAKRIHSLPVGPLD